MGVVGSPFFTDILQIFIHVRDIKKAAEMCDLGFGKLALRQKHFRFSESALHHILHGGGVQDLGKVAIQSRLRHIRL